jgi:hypothetical protein
LEGEIGSGRREGEGERRQEAGSRNCKEAGFRVQGSGFRNGNCLEAGSR